ncbi:MAG TPA: hypothetical protein VGH65_02855, partial [Verrucomicrobiaceae bacterium]
MKPTILAALIPVLVLMQAPPVRAQRFLEPGSPEKDLQETSRVLGQAQSNVRSETSRQAGDNGRLDVLAAEAQKKLKSFSGEDERKLIEAVDQRLEPAMKELAPEGRAIVAQSAAAPAMRAPDPDAPVTGARPKRAAVPATATAGPNKANPADAPPKDIDIKSEDAVYLDSAQALAVFTGDVVLDHPQFHMTSDKLE